MDIISEVMKEHSVWKNAFSDIIPLSYFTIFIHFIYVMNKILKHFWFQFINVFEFDVW